MRRVVERKRYIKSYFLVSLKVNYYHYRLRPPLLGAERRGRPAAPAHTSPTAAAPAAPAAAYYITSNFKIGVVFNVVHDWVFLEQNETK